MGSHEMLKIDLNFELAVNGSVKAKHINFELAVNGSVKAKHIIDIFLPSTPHTIIISLQVLQTLARSLIQVHP